MKTSISKDRRATIADDLGLSESLVQEWFDRQKQIQFQAQTSQTNALAIVDGDPFKNYPKYRSRYEKWQLDILVNYLQINPNPSGPELEILSNQTKIDKKKVYFWFSNRRRSNLISKGWDRRTMFSPNSCASSRIRE